LSREAVVEAALDCLRAGGPAGLTMRRVAARLETGPASLYTFVRDQRELHVLVLDSIAAMVPRPSARTEGQQDTVVDLLLDYARQLHAFPGAARLALLTPPTGPAFLDLLETAIERLVGEGLSIVSAERACDALFLLVTASIAEQEAPTGDDPARSIPDLYEEALDADSTSRPYLAAAREAMRGEKGGQRLEWSLRAFLAGAKRSSSDGGGR
jgi:AcrR family transcriptional regulator